MEETSLGVGLDRIGNHPLRGGWWMLDAETSGFDPLTDDIVAVCLAYMEAYEIHQEVSFCVRPKFPLKPEIVKLTGITPEDLQGAVSIDSAVKRIGMFVADAPLLVYHTRFLLPFLRAAFHHHASEEFDYPCLSLSGTSMRVLGGEKEQRLATLARQLPAPEADLPQDHSLAMMYRVSTALFERLESRGARTVDDLLALCGEEQP